MLFQNREVVLAEKLAAQLLGDDKYANRLSWKFHTMTMAGEQGASPRFCGEVTVRPSRRALQPSRHLVSLEFIMKDRRLELVRTRRITGMDGIDRGHP